MNPSDVSDSDILPTATPPPGPVKAATIPALWGRQSLAPKITSTSETNLKDASMLVKESTSAVRKRRRKEHENSAARGPWRGYVTPGQARLVRDGDGLGVAHTQPDLPKTDVLVSSESESEVHITANGTSSTPAPTSGVRGAARPRGRVNVNGKSPMDIKEKGSAYSVYQRRRPRTEAETLVSSLHSPDIIDLVSSDSTASSQPVNGLTATHLLYPPRDIEVTCENALTSPVPLPQLTQSFPLSKKGSGAPHDPVRVDDESSIVFRREIARAPKKIIFSSDTRSTHSFFSRPSIVCETSTLKDRENTVTEAKAVSSPSLSATVPTKASNSVNPFVGQYGRDTEPGKFAIGWGNCREGEELDAPWPSQQWPSSHLVTDLRTRDRKLQRRQRPGKIIDQDDEFWNYVLQVARISTPPPKNSYQKSTLSITAPPFVLDHPAIAAVQLNTQRSAEIQQSWTDRHRPRTATAVLGNEIEAQYLRDWLASLSVRRDDNHVQHVVRRVTKRRNDIDVDSDHAWLVDDTAPIEDPGADNLEINAEPLDNTFPHLDERPNNYPSFGTWMANTIVLAGPSGSGKSAAVYAAASELGWDVFEIYPGVGRRTGTNLLALVGEVGKNHMVSRRESAKVVMRSGAAPSISREARSGCVQRVQPASELAKVSDGFGRAIILPSNIASSQGSATDPIEVDQGSNSDRGMGGFADEYQTLTQQSLILIDEADILFDSEETLWPTLVSFAAESRRPLVITCNDATRIPLDMLPLQTTLHFRPPPMYLAIPYLGAIARANGINDDASSIVRACHRQRRPDLIDQPLPPNGNEPTMHFDLRAAITQLQLDRGAQCEIPCKDVEDLDHSLDEMSKRLDTASFADAYIAPRDWARLEVVEIDRLAPCADDEQGIVQLVKPDVQHLYPTLALFDMSSEIAATLVALSGGEYLSEESTLQYQQTQHIRALLSVLDPIVPLTARLLPHQSLFLDLVPYLRAIVLADDMLEAADCAALSSGVMRVNRRTGRSMRVTSNLERQRHVRYINISPEARETIRQSLL